MIPQEPMMQPDDPCLDLSNQLDDPMEWLRVLVKLLPAADDSELTRPEIVALMFLMGDLVLKRLCRKFYAGGAEGAVALVREEIRRPERRTVRLV
jgi:hypothetical protein